MEKLEKVVAYAAENAKTRVNEVNHVDTTHTDYGDSCPLGLGWA